MNETHVYRNGGTLPPSGKYDPEEQLLISLEIKLQKLLKDQERLESELAKTRRVIDAQKRLLKNRNNIHV